MLWLSGWLGQRAAHEGLCRIDEQRA
jgi:hypothetical protein